MKDIECDDTKQFWIEMNEEGPIENEKCHFKVHVKKIEIFRHIHDDV